MGFLNTPKSIAIFLQTMTVFLFVLTGAYGFIWAFGQDDTGSGEWRTDKTVEITGLLETEPYPMLRVQTTDNSVETVLLVEGDKRGIGRRATGLNGKMVKITGYEIVRDSQRMITLLPGEEALLAVEGTNANSSHLVAPQIEPIGTYTLKGEILDSKCYLGVMKPGQGKTHKSCATLCILGDIPPMFMVRHTETTQSAYLLLDQWGNAIKDKIIPFVADPVEITGIVGWRGDLPVFMIDPQSIRRLSSSLINRYTETGAQFAVCSPAQTSSGAL